MNTNANFRCALCHGNFFDEREAASRPCRSLGESHMLQPLIQGSINPDDKSQADFVSVDSADLKKWGEQAKKIYGDGN